MSASAPARPAASSAPPAPQGQTSGASAPAQQQKAPPDIRSTPLKAEAGVE